MNICFCVVILVIFCVSLGKADVHELGRKNERQNSQQKIQGYHYSKISVSDYRLNEKSKPHILTYKHSVPKAIDDPLPEKVNYVLPVVVDFHQVSQQQVKPLFIPAFAPNSLTPQEELLPPVDKYRAKPVTSTRKPHSTTKSSNNDQTTSKASTSSQQKIKDVYKPEMLYPAVISDNGEIVLINHHHGEETGFELFNVHDDMPLISHAPEVIFKPGDDTSFANDLTVFDDYEHTFPPVAKNKENTKELAQTTTAAKPYKPATTTTTTTTKRPNYHSGKYTASAEKSDVTANSFHGYVYEKPSIPFDT